MHRSTRPFLLSIAAHLVAVAGIVRAGDGRDLRAPVTIEIVRRPPPPAPAPVLAAGPPAPLVPPPVARTRPRAMPRRATPAPLPMPVLSPVPTPAPAPQAVVLPVAVPQARPAVAVAPPQRPAGAGGVDLSGYLGAVNRAVAQRRRYPQMAIQLQLEGIVEVRLCLRSDGSLAARPTVLRSSGHALLDDEALQMVARSAPFPRLPDSHGGGIAELRVPVRFYLD